GSLAGAGVSHDVGDRGVPVSAFGDRLRETLEQPTAKRMPGIRCDGSGGRGGTNGHHAPPSGTCRWALPSTVLPGTVLHDPLVPRGTSFALGVIDEQPVQPTRR